jgi:hypothetical protein
MGSYTAQTVNSMYSKQVIYCNACGKRMVTEIPKVFGREFKCCSSECIQEMQWRETLSIMGKEYYPKKEHKELLNVR